MLQVSDLSKRYGDVLLFAKASFVVNAGDRVGLVGPNSCGKTTLLRVLVGDEQPDRGSVSYTIPRDRIGYLPQALTEVQSAAEDSRTVRDLLEGSSASAEAFWAARVQELATAMARAQGAELERLGREYVSALDHLDQAAKRLPDHVIERVLAGLDLYRVAPSTPVGILSGGQKTRLGLARILLASPLLLLLDEPTNHLDITALEWLEGYLAGFDGGMLIVSHDRTFLDHTVTSIVEMEPRTHAVNAYPGTYSDYAAAKEREAEKHWATYREQEERVTRLESAVRQLQEHSGKIQRESVHFYYRKRARKLARQATVRQKRLERMIASQDHLDKPVGTWELSLEFADTPASGQDVLVLEELTKQFGDLLLFEGVDMTLRRGERIALIGPNGSGKTTLLRIIAGEEPATDGVARLGANVHLGYLSQEQDHLDWRDSVLQTVQRVAPMGETEARTFLHRFLFAGDDVFAPVGKLSYGERTRLALGVLVLEGCNLLLLDEPINHLDIPSRQSFERALAPFEGTIVAVVHDRYFVDRFATAIWALENCRITRYVDLEDARRQRSPAMGLGPDESGLAGTDGDVGAS